MDNRKLTPGEHLASLRRLWKECFNDTDEFIDMYFTRVYSPQVDYSIERDGRVVSALQCLPYNMLCGGNTVLAGYLSGVCTDASYRRQGLAGSLVAQSVADMHRRGCTFAFLIPSGSEVLPFYRQYGFYIAIRRSAMPIRHSGNVTGGTCTVTPATAYSDVLYRLFARRQRERRGYALLHSREQFKTVVDDWIKGGNLILTARLGKKTVSYLFVRPDNEKKVLYVYDAPAGRDAAFASMAGQARGMYPGYDMRAYITGHRAHNTFACARITDTSKALAAYAAMHPEADMQISVSGDKLIESNNGFYTVSHGQCTRSSAHAGSFTAMTLAQLTRMIFSGDKMSFNFLLE